MTLSEIVDQLKRCGYQCEAGPLEMNVAFQELEARAKIEEVANTEAQKWIDCVKEATQALYPEILHEWLVAVGGGSDTDRTFKGSRFLSLFVNKQREIDSRRRQSRSTKSKWQ